MRIQTIRGRIVLAIVLVGCIPLLISLVLAYVSGMRSLRDVIGGNLQAVAIQAADRVTMLVQSEVQGVRLLGSAPLRVRQPVEAANRSYPADAEKSRRLPGRSAACTERSGVLMMKHMCAVVMLAIGLGVASVLAGPPKAIQEHGKAMLRDAEEMVMHGGMGDGKAILHHCAEVAKHATAILGALPKGDEHGQAAAPHMQDVITHCKRVADMGDKVDPGASLNPATKARAAAREAMKHLAAMRDSGA